MNDLILSGLGIVCAAAFAVVTAYRVAPGLSEAMSAWAKKQDDLSKNRLAEEWVQGYQDGQEVERQKVQRTQ